MNRLYQTEIEKNMYFSNTMVRSLINTTLIYKRIKWLEDIIYIIKNLNYNSNIFIPITYQRKKRYYYISHDDYRIVFVNLKPNLVNPLIIYMYIKDLSGVFISE